MVGRGNRALGAVFRETVLALVRERYVDFGPTLAAEKLSELHGLDLGIETLRQWMLLAVAALILAVIAGIQAWILATTDASTRESARAAIKPASTAEDALKK